MSRPLRIEYPGAFYHIINRGLERREIFKSPKDYQYFLSLLDQMHLKYGLIVHSYCLMPNHYHLYAETPYANLSKIMRQINGIYTQTFNHRYHRAGPLMQGRYKAVVVDKDSYSLELSRYIHLNPVRAKIVEKPESYRWSSYASFIKKAKVPEFLNNKWLLSQFDKSSAKAIKSFKHFTLQGLAQEWTPEKESYQGFILGTSKFISHIQETYLRGKKDHEIPSLAKAQKQLSLNELQYYLEKLTQDTKMRKKLTAYALKRYSSLRLKEIGEILGSPSYSAVAVMVSRLNKEAQKDKDIKRLLEKIEHYCRNV
ncbi:MAG: transposase [Candidatus Paceibacterota bacterium]